MIIPNDINIGYQVMTSRKALVFCLLVVAITSDSFVTFSCVEQGFGGAKITVDGGGFDQYGFYNNSNNCSQSFYSYNFHCGPTTCFDGCQITEAHANTQDIKYCDSSDQGLKLIDSLNAMYVQYLPTVNITVTSDNNSYNWCDCGINHAILVGIIVGSIIGVSCCCCCVGWCLAICRKKSSMKETNQNFIESGSSSIYSSSRKKSSKNNYSGDKSAHPIAQASIREEL